MVMGKPRPQTASACQGSSCRSSGSTSAVRGSRPKAVRWRRRETSCSGVRAGKASRLGSSPFASRSGGPGLASTPRGWPRVARPPTASASPTRDGALSNRHRRASCRSGGGAPLPNGARCSPRRSPGALLRRPGNGPWRRKRGSFAAGWTAWTLTAGGASSRHWSTTSRSAPKHWKSVLFSHCPHRRPTKPQLTRGPESQLGDEGGWIKQEGGAGAFCVKEGRQAGESGTCHAEAYRRVPDSADDAWLERRVREPELPAHRRRRRRKQYETQAAAYQIAPARRSSCATASAMRR